MTINIKGNTFLKGTVSTGYKKTLCFISNSATLGMIYDWDDNQMTVNISKQPTGWTIYPKTHNMIGSGLFNWWIDSAGIVPVPPDMVEGDRGNLETKHLTGKVYDKAVIHAAWMLDVIWQMSNWDSFSAAMDAWKQYLGYLHTHYGYAYKNILLSFSYFIDVDGRDYTVEPSGTLNVYPIIDGVGTAYGVAGDGTTYKSGVRENGNWNIHTFGHELMTYAEGLGCTVARICCEIIDDYPDQDDFTNLYIRDRHNIGEGYKQYGWHLTDTTGTQYYDTYFKTHFESFLNS